MYLSKLNASWIQTFFLFFTVSENVIKILGQNITEYFSFLLEVVSQHELIKIILMTEEIMSIYNKSSI